MSRYKQRKLKIYIHKDTTIIRMENIGPLYLIYIKNIHNIMNEEGDVRKYRTLYIPDIEYTQVLNAMAYKEEKHKEITKINLFDDNNKLIFMLRSDALRENDMKHIDLITKHNGEKT